MDHLEVGSTRLDPDQAHHLRDVLRMKAGEAIEPFTDDGLIGEAVIDRLDSDQVWLRIDRVWRNEKAMQIMIASALPKGQRADWMIEKLSELGVDRFIPLSTARSVVEPSGKNKHERWERIATESAKQSRRGGVMQIDTLTVVDQVMAQHGEGFYLSTDPAAVPILGLGQSQIQNLKSKISLYIGPEGGWTNQEIELFHASSLTGVKLTGTILRVETAAVAAAAIVASIRDSYEVP